VGLDISRTFVAIARDNARRQDVQVDFCQGDASRMPLASDQFQFLVCRAAFKNFSRPVEALREMRRVLAPGGTALIVDLRPDASREEVDAEVRKMGLSALNALLTRWTFRCMLLKRAYSRAMLENFIAQSGFEQYDIQEAGIGYDVWLTKGAAGGA